MKKIRVNLGERSYNIFIGYDVLSRLKAMLPDGNGMVVTDSNVLKFWGKDIKRLGLPVFSITPGESSKKLKTAEKIYSAMLKNGLNRKSFLVAFGGGVVGDLAGFAASTYMRGIPYVQVPTTLMAQVDSSIGGKTGVDLPQGKNLVGCFCQPLFVFVDIKLLKSLPLKELKSGLAEVIKYGIIKDEKLFSFIEEKASDLFNIESEMWEPIVSRCAKIKADIVSKDERETKGLRAILNYGHTIGHAIEAVNQYRGVTHGEAVARGMICAGILANDLGRFSDKDLQRQNDLINQLVCSDKKISYSGIAKHIKHDKKNIGNKIRFVLADKIGHVFLYELKESNVARVLKF
jgi:3-dehydroquinate synthase